MAATKTISAERNKAQSCAKGGARAAGTQNTSGGEKKGKIKILDSGAN